MAPVDCIVNPKLRELLNETQDFIDCDDFHTVLNKAMDRVTQKCLENVAQKSNLKVLQPPPPQQTNPQIFQYPNQHCIHPRFIELKDDDDFDVGKMMPKNARFVAILPIITKESHHILNSLPNEYTEVGFLHHSWFVTSSVCVTNICFFWGRGDFLLSLIAFECNKRVERVLKHNLYQFRHLCMTARRLFSNKWSHKIYFLL